MGGHWHWNVPGEELLQLPLFMHGFVPQSPEWGGGGGDGRECDKNCLKVSSFR